LAFRGESLASPNTVSPDQPTFVLAVWPWPSWQNFIDHGVTDQASVLQFIEDNWSLGRIGNQSADAIAGSLLPMFDFSQPPAFGERRLILDSSTGQPANGNAGGQ